MNTAEMMLAIEDEYGPVGECTCDDFTRDNFDGLSAVEIADVAHLAVGESLTFGGGAQPTFTVRRIA